MAVGSSCGDDSHFVISWLSHLVDILLEVFVRQCAIELHQVGQGQLMDGSVVRAGLEGKTSD